MMLTRFQLFFLIQPSQVAARGGSTAWVRKAMSYFLAVTSLAPVWVPMVGTPISLATSLTAMLTPEWMKPNTATAFSFDTRRR